jgi:hypothetical protein
VRNIGFYIVSPIGKVLVKEMHEKVRRKAWKSQKKCMKKLSGIASCRKAVPDRGAVLLLTGFTANPENSAKLIL